MTPVVTNKRYEPPKNNQNNFVPLKSTNTSQNQPAKKEDAAQIQKKPVERK